MKKILLYDCEEIPNVEDIIVADVVGSIDKNVFTVKIIKSRKDVIGRKVSLREFGSLAAIGEI